MLRRADVIQSPANRNFNEPRPICKAPYFRLQSGANAVILDPQVGDIGLACVADRDISSVKVSKQSAPAASKRHHDMADALYIGGVLNGAPTQYVQFNAEGITLFSPTKVTIQAPAIAMVGAVSVSETLTAAGDVVGAGVSLSTHLTKGVAPGSGVSGPPQAT